LSYGIADDAHVATLNDEGRTVDFVRERDRVFRNMVFDPKAAIALLGRSSTTEP
jgi:hypothetical protein